MEKTKIFEIEEKCTIRQKFGKCIIPLKLAFFCMDCFTIHLNTICPNCLSNNSVRLIELFLSEPDLSDEELREIIRKKFLKIS